MSGSLFKDAGLVALGGAAGSLARWWVSLVLPAGSGWSWATFAVNASGAFLLGLLLEALTRPGRERRGAHTARMLLGTGLLGGFTTYSTFALELWERVRSGAACRSPGGRRTTRNAPRRNRQSAFLVVPGELSSPANE